MTRKRGSFVDWLRDCEEQGIEPSEEDMRKLARLVAATFSCRACERHKARVEALEKALREKASEWIKEAREEMMRKDGNPLIAGTWKLCADDVYAALADGEEGT